MIYYNWEQLKKSADNEFYSILVLTYCLYKGYNKQVGKDDKELCKILKIPYIPQYLFRRGLLVKGIGNSVINRFKIIEPQSYINDVSFLWASKYTAYEKVVYLAIASKRSIADKTNKIPKQFIKEQHLDNCLITIQDNDVILKY